jgi:hypothetical protein
MLACSTLSACGSHSSSAGDGTSGAGGSGGVGAGAHASGSSAPLSGTVLGAPFSGASVLNTQPQAWKSAAVGATALLVGDTPNLCAQFTAGKVSAPSRLVSIRLEQRDASGSIVPLTPGTFSADGESMPNSRFGDVYVSGVNAQCGFDKDSTDQVSIQVTAVSASDNSISISLTAHFKSGASLTGSVSATGGCDQVVVDNYLNSSPKCG